MSIHLHMLYQIIYKQHRAQSRHWHPAQLRLSPHVVGGGGSCENGVEM
jgi:hypothetical protein